MFLSTFKYLIFPKSNFVKDMYFWSSKKKMDLADLEDTQIKQNKTKHELSLAVNQYMNLRIPLWETYLGKLI